METNENSSQHGSNNSSPQNNSPLQFAEAVKFDLPWIFARLQEIVFNPKGCWDALKAEALSPQDLYGRYLIPLALFSSICGFIGGVWVGIELPFGTFRIPFFSGLIYYIFAFLASLGSFFISAFIINKLAPKFDTHVSLDEALRLVGYAATPGLLAGIVSIVPGALMTLAILILSVYSLYLLWSGFGPMTGVNESKKIPFFLSTLVCSILASVVIFGLTSAFFEPPYPSQQDINDMEKIQQNLQEIQKMVPSNN